MVTIPSLPFSCTLFLVVQSIMSSSLRSRQRARAVSWEDVLTSRHLKGLTVPKDELVKCLEKYTDAADFLNYPKEVQAGLCELSGITGWEDAIISAINDMVR